MHAIIRCMWLLILFPVLLRGEIDKNLKSRIDEIANRFVESNRINGLIVGIIAPDSKHSDEMMREVFTYGLAPKEKLPHSRTVLRIGSVTKVFTTTILADFVKRGIVKLNDPVEKYLPGAKIPSFGDRKITFLDLATHTSGLPDLPNNFRNYNTYSNQDFLSFLAHYRLTRSPGTEYVYSDSGFALLGYTLQVIAGEKWEKLLVEKVCDPLDLPDTRAILTREQGDRALPSYTKNGKAVPYNSYNYANNPLIGSGGLYSTMDDMMKFLAYNMGLTDISLDALLPILQQKRFPVSGSSRIMCLGWMLMPIQNGMMAFTKNGSVGGYTAYVNFIKESKTGVVVMSNQIPIPQEVGQSVLTLLNSTNSQ